MTSLALPIDPAAATSGRPRPAVERLVLVAAVPLVALFAAALLRHAVHGGPSATRTVWLAVHLGAVLPAVPLGGYLLWARKGDRRHQLLGKLWTVLMMATALSSFGLRGTGHLSWIHALALVTLVSVPHGAVLAMRGRIAAHRRVMLRVYASLVVAGFFTFLPGRLFGMWLFG